MSYSKIKKLPTAQPLTDEQKKAQVLQFLAQKREEYASNIFYRLCESAFGSDENNMELVVEYSVGMADRLVRRLFPLPKEEKADEEDV